MTIVHESRRASRAAIDPQRRTQAPPTRARCVPLRDPPNVPRPSSSGSTNPPPTRRGARFPSGFRLPSLIEKGIPNRRPASLTPLPLPLRDTDPASTMGKAKKEVQVDDDDAIFAQRAMELKGASPPGPLRADPRAIQPPERSTRRGVKNAILPNFPRRVYSYDIVPSPPRPSETDLGGSLPLPTRQTRRRRSSPRATPSRRRRRTTRR